MGESGFLGLSAESTAAEEDVRAETVLRSCEFCCARKKPVVLADATAVSRQYVHRVSEVLGYVAGKRPLGGIDIPAAIYETGKVGQSCCNWSQSWSHRVKQHFEEGHSGIGVNPVPCDDLVRHKGKGKHIDSLVVIAAHLFRHFRRRKCPVIALADPLEHCVTSLGEPGQFDVDLLIGRERSHQNVGQAHVAVDHVLRVDGLQCGGELLQHANAHHERDIDLLVLDHVLQRAPLGKGEHQAERALAHAQEVHQVGAVDGADFLERLTLLPHFQQS